MKKSELKKQYIAHCENTAPDMEKLWEKIESGLEEKPESRVTSKPAKSFNFRRAAAWCTACAAVLIAVPAFIIGTSLSSKTADFTANEAVAGDVADGFFSETDAVSLPDTVSYGELKFNPQTTVEQFPPTPTAEPFGDDFFVEEKVLAETDIIVDAVVQNAVYNRGGGTVIYELTSEDTGNITVESASPYVLKMGGEYVLPLKETEEGYRLVFENAPQIECTLDGGVIFHNGWRSLDENSCWVSYPRNTVDDFFYDRMRFSYIDVMTALTDKWKNVNNNAKEE